MMLFITRAFFVLLLPTLAYSDPSFDPQILNRVTVAISSFTTQISHAAFVNYQALAVGALDPYVAQTTALQTLLYPTKYVNNALILAFHVGFSDNTYYSIVNDLTTTSGLDFQQSSSSSKTTVFSYDITTATATPSTPLSSRSYTATTRPWYTAGKTSGTSAVWSASFLFSLTNVPTVAFVVPLNSVTTSLTSGFQGSIAFNINFDALSAKLTAALSGTDAIAFIVEKSSGYLFSNNVGAKTFSNTGSSLSTQVGSACSRPFLLHRSL